MYKPYSDSYLMKKSKKTLIEYLRVAEHNHRVCAETIEQQAKNCMELLKKERADAIEEMRDTFTEELFNRYAWSDGTMNFNNCSLMIREMLEVNHEK